MPKELDNLPKLYSSKSHKNLFLKVFIPFVIGLFVIQTISLLSLDEVYKKYQSNRTSDIIKHIKVTYNNKLKANNELYKEVVTNIQSDKNIAKYFLEKDREKLYNYTKDIYARLHKNFKVTHFYFHGLDRKVFLRVHNSKKHSDTINRFTLKEAQETLENSFGVEFGIAHNLTSRSVFPYYIDNKLVGYLELGEEIDYFTDYFSKTFGAEVLVVIKNEFIDIKNLRLTSKLEKLVSTYPKTKNYYIINSTLVNIDENLKNLIDIKTINQSDNYIDIENITYELESLDIQDIEKRFVGKIVVLIDTKTDQISLKSFKFNVSIFISAISFAIMLIYYMHLRYTTKQLNKSTSEIIKLSITDQLTNLYNRRYFNEMVPIELQKAIDNKKAISFMMLDIDNFKKYNDNYGHLKGDEVLEKVSLSLKKTLKRSTDMVFRLGGEEFCVVIIENTKVNTSSKVAQEILKSINDLSIEHLHNQPHNIITVSMGISIKKADEILSLDTLYKNADTALYESKNNGKNKYSVYTA